MAWSFQYQPKPDSYPNGEIVVGTRGVELIDETPDGGVALKIGQGYSGRRVKAESVAKVICWFSKRPLQDYEELFLSTVSDRLRDLIEELEPGVHQFEPVQFVAKDGRDLGTRWFWQICNRLDSVNREHTRWFLKDNFSWYPPSDYKQSDPFYPVFDLEVIGARAFWHDKHIGNGNFCSDLAKEKIESNKITGFRFSHREQV